jgi:hypothetical protein
LFFLAGKDNFGNKRITSEQFFREEVSLFLKNVSQYNFFFSFFREKYNLLIWSTLSTFEEAVRFLIKGDRNSQDPFFQKAYPTLWCYV